MDQAGFLAVGGGWLALALVNAGLAEQKSRSRVTWLLVLLVLGPLATGIIVWRPAPDGTLDPSTSRLDRYLFLALVFLVAGVTLGILTLFSGNWYLGGGAITGIALFLWMLLLHRSRAAGPD
jgi:hypothetical protein